MVKVFILKGTFKLREAVHQCSQVDHTARELSEYTN